MVCELVFYIATSFLQMTYQRSYNNTNKAVNCVQWTEAEQERLLQLQRQFGSNWSLLSSSYFPGRNPNQLKCKFNYLSKRRTTKTEKHAAKPAKTESSQSLSESKKAESLTESRTHTSPEEDLQLDDFDLMFDLLDFE